MLLLLTCCKGVLHICMQMFTLRILIAKAKYYNNIYAKACKFL